MTRTVPDVERGAPATMWSRAAIVTLGAFVTMLWSTMVNAALPALAAHLHASGRTIDWLASGYLLALATGVPLSAWASARVGLTRLWFACLALFVIFSLVCGMAPNMPALLGARVMQGLVGGLLVPVGQTIIGHVVDRARLGRIMSTIGIAIVVAPLLGTSLGATLVEHGGWRLLFWSPIPLCVLAITLGLPRLPPLTTEGPTRLDWVSALAVLTGLPLLLSTVATDVTAGNGPGRYCALMLGTLLIAVFVVRMGRAKAPLLNLALLKEPRFACCAAIMAIGGAVSFGGQYLLPLFFVDVRGQSLTAAALMLTPQIAGSAIGLPLAGWLIDRNGARMVLVAGGTITCLATCPFAVMGAHTNDAVVGLIIGIRGFGVALTTTPAMVAGLAIVERRHFSHAAPILNVMQRLGAAFGTAGIVAVCHAGTSIGGPTSAIGAFHRAIIWLAVAAAVVVVAAIGVGRRSAVRQAD